MHSEYIIKEALELIGDFKIGGKVICTVKYADGLMLLAKEGTVRQGMIDRLIEIRRYYGMEMNVEETEVMRMLRNPSPVKNMIDQKQQENMDYLRVNSLVSMITNDARCTREIESRITMAKQHSPRRKLLLQVQLDLNLRKKLLKFYIWSIVLYIAENGRLREIDQKCLGISEIWCWRRIEKISWTDRLRNEEALH
jgi:hypothetical protein